MPRREVPLGNRIIVADIGDEGRITIGSRAFQVEPLGGDRYRVRDDTRQWIVSVAGPPHERWIAMDGHVARLDLSVHPRGRTRGTTAEDALSAPMPATVVKVQAEPGAAVKRGDTLIVLEAMKMELAVRAPRDGRVAKVLCTVGELVQPGIPLLELQA